MFWSRCCFVVRANWIREIWMLLGHWNKTAIKTWTMNEDDNNNWPNESFLFFYISYEQIDLRSTWPTEIKPKRNWYKSLHFVRNVAWFPVVRTMSYSQMKWCERWCKRCFVKWHISTQINISLFMIIKNSYLKLINY